MASLPEAAYRHQLYSTLLLDPGQSVLSPHYQAKRESWENKKREGAKKKPLKDLCTKFLDASVLSSPKLKLSCVDSTFDYKLLL